MSRAIENAATLREARMPPTIYTIGHSDRSAEEFVELLQAASVRLVVDVRRVPGSRHSPWFSADELCETLKNAGIRYEHYAVLGGFRTASPDSRNTAWRNERFRGYADYMQTPEFSEALDGLWEEASETTTAIMCAEAVPWRCHRSLIADALLVRGAEVLDIIGSGEPRPHHLTPFVQVADGAVTYPG